MLINKKWGMVIIALSLLVAIGSALYHGPESWQFEGNPIVSIGLAVAVPVCAWLALHADRKSCNK